MGPAWTDAVRFPAGTRLRFASSLSPSWQAALVQAEPRAAEWLSRIGGVVLTVDEVGPAGCVVSAREGAEAASLGEVATAVQADGSHRVRVRWAEPAATESREFAGLALMLGGGSEVTLAQRGNAGVRPLLRWRYEPEGTVAVWVYTAAVTDRVPAFVRALLPREVRVGILQPVSRPGGALGAIERQAHCESAYATGYAGAQSDAQPRPGGQPRS